MDVRLLIDAENWLTGALDTADGDQRPLFFIPWIPCQGLSLACFLAEAV